MMSESERTVSRFKILLVVNQILNIAFACALILPWTYQWYFHLLNTINLRLNGGGLPVTISSDGVHILLINTAGIDMVLIAFIMLYASRDPVKHLAIPALHVFVRLFLFTLTIYYTAVHNIAMVFLALGMIDLVFLAGYIHFIRKLGKNLFTPNHKSPNSNERIRKTVGQFRLLLLFSGLFNIIVASPAAFPFSYPWYFRFINHVSLITGGVPVAIALDGVHALFVNAAAVQLVLIGIIVLYAAMDPVGRSAILWMNAAGRTLFFLIIVYLTSAYDIARLMLAFGILDLVISLGFVHYCIKLKKENIPPL